MYNMNDLYNQKDFLETIQKHKNNNHNNYWNLVTEEMNSKYGMSDGKETWRSRFRMTTDTFNKSVSKNNHSYTHNKDKQERLLNYLKTNKSIDFLTEMLDMSEIELLGNIELLRNKGYEIQNVNNEYKIVKSALVSDVTYKLAEGDISEIYFCAVSDTHLGSKKQQVSLLHLVYDECIKRGIKTVLHSGDISEGCSNRPEHKYEVFAHGADEQADYIINNYPRRDGITTYFITGNHDGWHFKNGGIDIGKMIGNAREDMIYLGNQCATVDINGCKIRLFHPLDGSSYAYSYSGQKSIDAIRGGDKPNILLTGHHHKMMYMIYRNIHYFEVPSLQGETNFGQGKRLSNDIGAWFIKAQIDELGNVISLQPEAMPFYRTIENDYNYENKPTTKVLKIKE